MKASTVGKFLVAHMALNYAAHLTLKHLKKRDASRQSDTISKEQTSPHLHDNDDLDFLQGFRSEIIEITGQDGITRSIPIPANREYTVREKYDLAWVSSNAVEARDNGHSAILWAANLAAAYRIMRGVGPDTPVFFYGSQGMLLAFDDASDDYGYTLEDFDVDFEVRFTDEQICTVVALSEEECEEALADPRYEGNMEFTFHWAGVGRDVEIYQGDVK